MPNLPTRRLTYANVMSTIAVILALTGGGFAVASHLEVRSSDIVDKAIHTKHIANQVITAPKIEDRAVYMDKLAAPLQRRVHMAQVEGDDGTLVSGDARSATRTGEGNYRVRFSRSVANCAGAATTGIYKGSTGATYRVSSFLEIGYAGGSPNPDKVSLRLFDASTGDETDTSFTLLLVCPR